MYIYVSNTVKQLRIWFDEDPLAKQKSIIYSFYGMVW